MERLNKDTVLQFEKEIEIIISKYEREIRDDIKQDLYMFLLDGFKNHQFDKAKDIRSYVFICLKNEALRVFKKKYNENMLSLDKVHDVYDIDLVDYNSIKDDGENSDVSQTDLREKICKICSEDDFILIYKYYVEKIQQNDLSRIYGVTPQAISKRIRNITNKLRKNLSK